MVINWEEQWASFAKGFKDGKAHIDLTPFGGASTLQLLPGPGFGDLSHQTTYLMLQLMGSLVKDKSILDIGCGSGILALSALLLGAKSAIGVDIDPEAIAHAQKNAALNNLPATFSDKIPAQTFDIALMNMITSEQQVVLGQKIDASIWIVSGILTTQKKQYITEAASRGWNLLQQAHRGEWLGLVFQTM